MLTTPFRVASVTKAVIAVLFCLIIGLIGIYIVLPYLGVHANTTFGKMDSQVAPSPSKSAAQVGIQVGNKAPEIEGEDIQGNKFKLSDYRRKVVMLDFWGHW